MSMVRSQARAKSSPSARNALWRKAAFAGVLTMTFMTAVPATVNAAATLPGCVRDEQVCLYDLNDKFVGAYSDVSSDWQTVAGKRVASARNLFSDYAVYFRHGSGESAVTSCIQPRREATFQELSAVTGIMIRPNGNCYPNGAIQ
jgi:hypothetical protein